MWKSPRPRGPVGWETTNKQPAGADAVRGASQQWIYLSGRPFAWALFLGSRFTACGTRITLQDTRRCPTRDSEDPYPPAAPFAESLWCRNTPRRHSAASLTPNASGTSAGTGTGALSSAGRAAPSPVPGLARLFRHAGKNTRKVAATTG